MTSDLDIYRSAKLLIDQHGDEAPIHAATQADAMLHKGDLDGVAEDRERRREHPKGTLTAN